jgi:Rab family protein
VSKIVEINEGDTRIRLQIWDTAGQDKFRAMTTNHYRNAVGALLVYDISNEESFNNLQYWLEDLRKNLDPTAIIALCANKVDIMFSSPEKREVLREQGLQFAKHNKLFYLDECSAVEDINVKETINGLVQVVYNV